MALKPTTIFARWIKANSGRIVTESEDFQHLITQVSFYLDLIEMNPNGITPEAAESAACLFKKLQAEMKARGMAQPDIALPKIKVVKPTG